MSDASSKRGIPLSPSSAAESTDAPNSSSKMPLQSTEAPKVDLIPLAEPPVRNDSSHASGSQHLVKATEEKGTSPATERSTHDAAAERCVASAIEAFSNVFKEAMSNLQTSMNQLVSETRTLNARLASTGASKASSDVAPPSTPSQSQSPPLLSSASLFPVKPHQQEGEKSDLLPTVSHSGVARGALVAPPMPYSRRAPHENLNSAATQGHTQGLASAVSSQSSGDSTHVDAQTKRREEFLREEARLRQAEEQARQRKAEEAARIAAEKKRAEDAQRRKVELDAKRKDIMSTLLKLPSSSEKASDGASKEDLPASDKGAPPPPAVARRNPLFDD